MDGRSLLFFKELYYTNYHLHHIVPTLANLLVVITSYHRIGRRIRPKVEKVGGEITCFPEQMNSFLAENDTLTKIS